MDSLNRLTIYRANPIAELIHNRIASVCIRINPAIPTLREHNRIIGKIGNYRFEVFDGHLQAVNGITPEVSRKKSLSRLWGLFECHSPNWFRESIRPMWALLRCFDSEHGNA
jgi:hypothetical protein